MADSHTTEYYVEQRRLYAQGRHLDYLHIFKSFRYPPLPTQGHIRLLNLHPSNADSLKLEGCLSIQKLDSDCEYEAVSYSWGDYPKFTKALFLNDQVYRYCDRPRTLWIDAICINQADMSEKSQQVAVMAEIYGKSKTVQVWLGPGGPWVRSAMDFMVDLSLKAESFGINCNVGENQFHEDIPSLNTSKAVAEKIIQDAIKSHVDVLLFSSWFNRLWVVQEATLATELVVSCGNSKINWPGFDQAIEILRGAYRQIPAGKERDRMDGIKPTWALVRHRRNFRRIDQVFKRNHHFMARLGSILMSNRNCSDDRDRVYAMLAMTTSPYTMSPDYDMTVAETYTEFTRRYSPNTQLFTAGLCRRKFPQLRDKESNTAPIDISDRDYLPSWVPEFRPPLNLAWASHFDGVYSTACSAPSFFIPHPEMRSVMHVGGILFDVVYTTSWRYDDTQGAEHRMFEPGFFFSLIDQLQDILEPPFASSSGFQPDSERLWLILAKVLTSGISDCEGAERMLSRYPQIQSLSYLKAGSLPWLTAIWDRFATHCISPTGEVFQHILLKTLGGEAKPLSPDANIALGLLNYLANILPYDRLFVTGKGYLGRAPRDIKPGDIIAILNGCDMPYVTRAAGKVKYKENEKTKEKDWEEVLGNADFFKEGVIQVIGPCYLQGIMKGEIFTNRDAPQFSHLKWTRYRGDTVDSLAGGLVLV
ncbi:heterokaryon incompatibility protein-domain-containing protein [Nemania sp. FL0031]|nr:heterokaryon incompatibility protein-domain-containing protein [Nemania sp. FL0031]